MNKRKIVAILSVFLLCVPGFLSISLAEEAQVIAGAGPSTKVVELFFSNFSSIPEASNYTFVVPPISTKHSGGIKNSDSFIFGRTGRPLNEEERALNKEEIFLAKVPIAFASGEGSLLPALSIDAIEKIFRGEIANWSELGGDDVEIVTVGRESSEAVFTELKNEYPSFNEASFDVTFNTDDQVVNFLKSPVGKYAIGFGASPNFSDINTIEVTERNLPGVRVGLVYDESQKDHPLVKAAIQYADSPEWSDMVKQTGMIPIKNGL